MNAPMKKHPGPTLYLIDNDPQHKAATCVGCTFARIVDSHFVHCEIQDRFGEFRLPPMFKDESNRGRQVHAGIPNNFCPYIHRVETWKTGKRVPRDFQQMLRDISHERGWREDCPGENKWYFSKKNWRVTADFLTHTFTFYNVRKNKA